jgi:hypothetical protein
VNIRAQFPSLETAAMDRAIRIARQAQDEIDRRSRRPDLYGRECIMDLREIRSLALGVQDHLSGHEGFETAESDLDEALADWAEIDCRTFAEPRLPKLPGRSGRFPFDGRG